jgi:hypothetical protein
MDPRVMVDITKEPGLNDIAEAVTGLLQEAIHSLN